MTLTLYRFHSDQLFTASILYLDGIYVCFVLEDAYHQQKIYGQTRIPAGEYKVILEYSPKMSPRYGHKMVSPIGIPNYTGVRFHRGMTAEDTEGCLLVGLGLDIVDRKLFRCVEGYEQFYAKVSDALERGEEGKLIIVDEQKRA